MDITSEKIRKFTEIWRWTKHQKEILELKNKILKLKNSLDVINSKLDNARKKNWMWIWIKRNYQNRSMIQGKRFRKSLPQWLVGQYQALWNMNNCGPNPYRRNINKMTFRYITVKLKKIPMTKTEKFEQNNNAALDNNNLKYKINIHEPVLICIND